MWDWLVFCDCGFHSVCPLMEEDKRLMDAFWWERLTEGETGSSSDSQGHAQYIFSLIFCWRAELCILPVISLGPNCDGSEEDNGDLLQKIPCMYCHAQFPQPCSRPRAPHATQDRWAMVESSDKIWSTEEGNGKPLQHSCLENTMNSKKGKNTGHWKMNSPGWQVPNMLLEISGQLNPERMKRGSLSKNSIQLWMWLVMEVVWCCKQQYCCKEPGMLGPWSRQIGSGQTGDGKSEHQQFRNQWTKMDRNGWI